MCQVSPPSYPVDVPGRIETDSILGARRDVRDLDAAAIVACSVLRSRIIFSLSSCLSACTVCACWRKLSSRENCLPQ